MNEERPSFEEMLEELERVITQLEEGGLALEETIMLFERGQQLIALCNARLDQAELRVEQLEAPPGEGEK